MVGPPPRQGTGGEPVPELRRISWLLFLALPVLLLLASGWLILAGIAVGSALITVFIYSFLIMTPIALYACLRELWSRIRHE